MNKSQDTGSVNFFSFSELPQERNRRITKSKFKFKF